MNEFLDYYGNKIELAFSHDAFNMKARHVLVICQYKNNWLLTKHKQRGLEFPGGKVERDEKLEEAARREVLEETGAFLSDLQFIAEYKVNDNQDAFVKAVFWGNVDRIEKTKTYFETSGPVIVEGDILQLRFADKFSFIMKDRVIEECLLFIHKKNSRS